MCDPCIDYCDCKGNLANCPQRAKPDNDLELPAPTLEDVHRDLRRLVEQNERILLLNRELRDELGRDTARLQERVDALRKSQEQQQEKATQAEKASAREAVEVGSFWCVMLAAGIIIVWTRW